MKTYLLSSHNLNRAWTKAELIHREIPTEEESPNPGNSGGAAMIQCSLCGEQKEDLLYLDKNPFVLIVNKFKRGGWVNI